MQILHKGNTRLIMLHNYIYENQPSVKVQKQSRWIALVWTFRLRAAITYNRNPIIIACQPQAGVGVPYPQNRQRSIFPPDADAAVNAQSLPARSNSENLREAEKFDFFSTQTFESVLQLNNLKNSQSRPKIIDEEVRFTEISSMPNIKSCLSWL